MPEVNKEMTAFQQGALVTISIGQKSWATTITPQDLGLAEFPANWKPGRKLLLPEEALQKISTIEGQARRYLDSRSFQYGRRKARVKFRFVEFRKLFDTILTLENYREQYFAAVKELKENYEALQKQMETDFPDQWSALSKMYPPFEQVEKAEAYYFLIDQAEMAFPSGLSAMQRYELEKIDKHLKEAEEAKVANLEELRRQAEANRQRLHRIAEEARREAEARVEEFVEESIKSLRGEVVKVFQQITEKIRDKKSLIKPNIDSMRAAIDRVKDMDFLDDVAFKQQLDQVKAVLDGTEQFKDNDAATAALNKVLGETISFVEKTTEAAVASAKKTYFARKLAI